MTVPHVPMQDRPTLCATCGKPCPSIRAGGVWDIYTGRDYCSADCVPPRR